MKFTINTLIAIALLCLTFNSVKAQTTAPQITATHLKAAEDFLISTGINKQFASITDNIIATFGKQMPEDKRSAFGDVMRKFMGKYYTWENVKPALSAIYAAEFDEKELKQLTAFYNTPTGKKYGEKISSLTQKGMLMGQQIVTDHKDELQKMMEEAFKPQ